jgi:hypothetical protein
VPPAPIQELRDLTRTRKQLTREIVQHVQRIQAVLEEANVKLSSVISDVLEPSGRRILRAIIVGETDAEKLAALGSERLGCGRVALTEALTGRIHEHHRFLLAQHLRVAASILTIVYHMVRDGTCYRDLGPEYFARRSPAKLAAKLANRIRNLGYHVEISTAA